LYLLELTGQRFVVRIGPVIIQGAPWDQLTGTLSFEDDVPQEDLDKDQ